MTYTHLGKQVLLDGAHFADAATPEAAEAIACAMNAPAKLRIRAGKMAGARTGSRILRQIADDMEAGVL